MFYGKLFLCFAVVFCLAQIPQSQADSSPYINWISLMKENCFKKYNSKKIDVQDELQDTIEDIVKKSFKFIEKSLKRNGNVQCIESTRDSHLQELKSEGEAAFSCLDQIRSTIDAEFSTPNMSVSDAIRTRNRVKSALSDCENSSKRKMKRIEKSFEFSGKRCLL